jgi:uncharacterized membrane protein
MSHWKSFGPAILVALGLLGETAGSAQAQFATEWSGGSVINLGSGTASGMNNAGQAVGFNGNRALEWANGSIIKLPDFQGSIGSGALGINDMGQAVGWTFAGGFEIATRNQRPWTGGRIQRYRRVGSCHRVERR